MIHTNKQNRKTHRYREKTDACQKGKGLGGWVKKVKELRSTNWQLQNSHGDIKDSIGDIVNNILITMYGVEWVQYLFG